MTVDLMHLVTKQQLARLHPTTKQELRAWLNNRLTPIIGRADMIANSSQNLLSPEDHAIEIAKACRKLHAEFEELFGESKSETTGAEKE